MGLQQDIVIVSQFGNKNPGYYIREYTSRKDDKGLNGIDATEPLEINAYISKYAPRISAVEQLKPGAVSDNEVALRDEDMSKKDGVMFGNRGISYDRETVEHAAYVTQKAADEGHTVIQPVISFSHDYLVRRGIVDKDMPEPTHKGDYAGKVDQLKLRQGLTEMMNKMHQEMGFNDPEWTGVVQFDTKHIHAHMTTIEKGEPLEKRMAYVTSEERYEQPDMKWLSDDKSSEYDVKENENGFISYVRDGEVVAEQTASKKGNPKWYKQKQKSSVKQKQERGLVGSKVQARMRDSLDRSLARSRDMKPFTKDIADKRQLTKHITKDNMYYNQEIVEKLQALMVALPKNKKQWRAKSNAKNMVRANELANDIVDITWTKYGDSVGIDQFDASVDRYVNVRQQDEGFGAEYASELKSNAYQRLREETINGIYKDLKQIKDKDKRIDLPKQSIKAASTEILQNEISDQFKREPHQYDQQVRMEYRARSYKDRFYDAKDQAYYAEREIKRYDRFKEAGRVNPDAHVIRDYYEDAYHYEMGRVDKYHYLLNGKKSHVSKDRFKEVRGIDLVSMLYDYGPNDNRSVPKKIAEQYQEQTEARSKAYRKMMSYLAQTGQSEMFNKLKDGMDALDDEAAISRQINSELNLPEPTRRSESSIETRKTIDTFKGRAVLHETLSNIESRTSFIRDDYDEKLPEYKSVKKDDEKVIDWSTVRNERDINQNHDQERLYWQFKRMQFEQYLRDERRREEEEKYQVRDFDIVVDEPEQDVSGQDIDREIEL